ncbi:MAG: hypothetical protein KJZ57_02820 [Anaerolineales bacterium]|nr:hypothetical protein [Anaerolineales bacterium]
MPSVNVCVLRSGGDYGPEHVRWLARQVPDLVCLSDVPVPGVETVGMRYGFPGWWSKLELFSEVLDGDLMYFDLDTVVFEVPKVDRTTVLRDFYYPETMGSGLMYIAQADKARVFEDFMRSPSLHMRRHSVGGDQAFLQQHLGDCQKWQDVAKVVSFKAHCQSGVPAGTQVCCFHGTPRPWHVIAPWVPVLEG